MSRPDHPRASVPADVPPDVVPFLEEAGYLEPDRLSVGDPAPDLPLFTPEGEEVRLSRCWRERAVVLIFGSYT